SVVGPRACIPAVSRRVVPPMVTVTGTLPFPASPHQSVHKVLPYTAYRRPSPEGMHGAAVRDVPSKAFQADALAGVDDSPLLPLRGWANTAAGFASCCGPLGCSHQRGLRRWASTPGVSPDAASLLPGSLVTTRTGLAPAGGG